MGCHSDLSIDTRTCGQAHEDAELDRRDGLALPAGDDPSSQPLNIPGASVSPDAGRQADDCTTRIVHDCTTRDYACYATVDGREELIGFAPNHSAASTLCREYRFSYYADRHTPERAAQIALEAEPAPYYAKPPAPSATAGPDALVAAQTAAP